jgi:hypothetical protein
MTTGVLGFFLAFSVGNFAELIETKTELIDEGWLKFSKTL